MNLITLLTWGYVDFLTFIVSASSAEH